MKKTKEYIIAEHLIKFLTEAQAIMTLFEKKSYKEASIKLKNKIVSGVDGQFFRFIYNNAVYTARNDDGIAVFKDSFDIEIIDTDNDIDEAHIFTIDEIKEYIDKYYLNK